VKYKKLVLVLISILVFSLLLVTPVLGATGFVKYAGNPVLSPGSPFDSFLAGASSVILDGSTYKMWYTGFNGSAMNICYATSPDGLDWTNKLGGILFNPVPGPGPWESGGIAAPCVIKNGFTAYQMWYTGINGSFTIGYATSNDGVTWTRQGAVLSGTSWETAGVALPSVINDGGTYKMWYTGLTNAPEMSIGYAEFNGLSWVPTGAPVLVKSPVSTDFDGEWVGACNVTKDGSSYSMYYTGFVYDIINGNQARIGRALSTDGIIWTKTSSSAVLDIGSSGSWDDKGVAAPSILQVNNTTKMWYTGGRSNLQFQIGYAEWSPEFVPASSPLSIGLLIGGIAVLMIAIIWGRRRFQFRQK
jgi:predicted GH43/DUF377 family glycosyl hydrolase